MQGSSSRSRLLSAINLEESDHVPLHLTFITRDWDFHGPSNWNIQLWRSTSQRQEELFRLGFDEVVWLEERNYFHPDVKIKQWSSPGEKYPLLFKVYETPEGSLRQVVAKTGDWPHGNDIPLYDDHLVPASRSREYLIKGSDDLKKLRYLLHEPSTDQIRRFHQRAREIKKYADRHGLLLEGDGGFGGDMAIWLCGVEKVLTSAFRHPDFLDELLDIIHEWDMRRAQRLLDTGVDVIVHRGWYENGDFWSPKLYKRFLEPRLREEIELVHRAGIKFQYIIATGIAPLLHILRDLGIDLLDGVDPVANPIDLHILRKTLKDTCLRGGISEAVTFQQGTAAEVRKAVKHAIKALAPGGGFILATIYSIYERAAWEKKGPVLIDAWRRYGKYPIRPDA